MNQEKLKSLNGTILNKIKEVEEETDGAVRMDVRKMENSGVKKWPQICRRS